MKRPESVKPNAHSLSRPAVLLRRRPHRRRTAPARSLVPTDVPQFIQRPPDSVLLERQFHLPKFDSFTVNDEVRLLLNGFRELPEDLQLSYNVILILSLVVMFIAFEGVELIREWNSNSEYVDRLESSVKKKRTPTTKDAADATGSELRDRRRGLGWLALITAIAVWMTGYLNETGIFGS